MDTELQKQGIRRLQKEFFPKFLKNIQEAKDLVDEITKDCSNTFSIRAIELLRREVASSSKRASLELEKLSILIEKLSDPSNVKEFNDVEGILFERDYQGKIDRGFEHI